MRKDESMFTRVLVPLDGSPRAERAIPVAARIAEASHGTVVLVRAATMPIEYGPALMPPLTIETMEAERTEFTGYLSEMAGLPVLMHIGTETEVLLGPPAQSIVEAASNKRADLIVMTSHGRTGFSRWLLGSVAQQVAHHAPVQVLVLREQGPMLAGPHSQHPDVEHLPRVLVPLDGSPLAEAALEPAAALVAALSVEPALHLALVVSPYEAIQANMPEALAVDRAKGYLGTAAERLKNEHPELGVTWSVGVGLDVAETIIRIAERGDDTEGAGVYGGCDAIAIATHGRTGFARWALGSITERVLQGTKLPLLIVRPPKVVAAAKAHSTNELTEVPTASAGRDGAPDADKRAEGDQEASVGYVGDEWQ